MAIVATGGLSHQVHGERCGFNNTDWDAQFVDMLVNDPEKLTEMTISEYATLGGMEGSEVIMWLVMRGALSANVTETWRDYYLPSMTGIATLILENNARTPPVDTLTRHRQHMAQQLAGVDNLPGTYPFTHERSLNGLRLNNFLHKLTQPTWRQRFLSAPQALYEEAELSQEEQRLLNERVWG